MSIMNLYSAESWTIFTALCVLSGKVEISSSSAVVRNDRCWASGHGDCPVVSSRPSDLRQRRPDDREHWAGNVVLSGDVDWQSADVVSWQCLRLVCSNRPGTWGLVMQTSAHCYSQLVMDAFWDVKPVQLVMQQALQAMVELCALYCNVSKFITDVNLHTLYPTKAHSPHSNFKLLTINRNN